MDEYTDESLDLSTGFDPTGRNDSVRGGDNDVVVNCRDANTRAVISKMASRAEFGWGKYQVTTERRDIDTLGWLTHLQEELMDACVYIERLKSDQRKGPTKPTPPPTTEYVGQTTKGRPYFSWLLRKLGR